MLAFVVSRILVGGARDPTSHNLWPFEILQVGALSVVVMGVLLLARKLTGAGRRGMSLLPSLGALFLVAIGAGVLAVAYRGYRDGELPAGTSGFRAYRPNREDDPLAFHVFLVLYFCGGMALAVWGLLALVGMAPPLKLR